MQVAKKPIKKIDIYNENFNHFFVEKLNKITPEQKALIPESLSFKIYRYGSEAGSEMLSFQEKMWILSTVFKHHVTIMVDDDERGICMKEFSKSQQALKGEIKNGPLLDSLRVHSSFIMADKELMASSLYMNHVCTTNIYSLVKELIENTSHKRDRAFVKAKKEINTILEFLSNYEATKRKIAIDYELTMPMWYALIYFSKNEKLGVDFYDGDFKYAYASNKVTMHRDMKRLQDMGYLLRRGKKLQYRYSLTGAGINLLDRIMNNIILKF